MDKNCYVTLLATDDYLYGVLGLWYSLQQTHAKYPLLVLITNDLDKKTFEVLDQFKIDYKIVPHQYFELDDGRWSHCANKFYCWGLTDFNKICFLDADCIVRSNLDFLFDSKTPIFEVVHNKIWGGFFVITPDKSFEEFLFNNYNTYFTDEEFFNCYFDDKIIYCWNSTWLLFHDDKVIKYWKRYNLENFNDLTTFLNSKIYLLYQDLGFNILPHEVKFSLLGGQ